MSSILENIDFDTMVNALNETLFMTFVSLIFAVIIGLILGIVDTVKKGKAGAKKTI